VRAKTVTFKRARVMRRQMTLPEVVLWHHLRGSRLAMFRFRRQHPIGAYILDFYCPAARLAIEVDGAGHGHPDQVSHDVARGAWLAANGIQTLRFAAADVLDGLSLADILIAIEAEAGARLLPPPPLRGPPPP
jgi:very-short-patch-repair endonuclease